MDNHDDVHLTDEQLVLHADDELSEREAVVVHEHLGACWSCRARLEDFHSTINTVARLLNEVDLPTVLPPPDAWPGLRPRLEAVANETAGSVVERVQRAFGLRSSFGVTSWNVRRAIAVAAMVVFAIWIGTDSASAMAARRVFVRLGEYVAALVRRPVVSTVPAPVVAARPVVTPPAKPPVKDSEPGRRITRPSARRMTPTELTELDLEVVSRLDRVGAFLGEQLAVTRDLERRVIQIRGVVDSDARRQELVGSLGPLATHRAVAINLSTAAEELAAQTTTPGDPVTIRSVDIDISPPPVHEEIRRHIGEKLRRQAVAAGEADPTDAMIRREIQTFTANVLNRSLQARLHARAMMQAVDRYSPEDLKQLSADARRARSRIIRQHAEAFQRETAALRSALEPIFFTPGVSLDGLAGESPADDADLPELAGRLLEFGSSHDATIARTFSRSTEATKPESTAWRPFERSLNLAERLAGRIAKLVNQ